MATHSSILAWTIPGTEEPSGLPSVGSRRVEHDWSDLSAAAEMIFKVVAWRILRSVLVFLGISHVHRGISSVHFSSVAQSCLTLCNPMNRSTPGLPVHHQLIEFTQTHVHRISDAIQPSHPLSSPSPAPNPSQHQGLFQWVNSSHEVAKVLEFQLQHQSFQWTPRTDLL